MSLPPRLTHHKCREAKQLKRCCVDVCVIVVTRRGMCGTQDTDLSHLCKTLGSTSHVVSASTWAPLPSHRQDVVQPLG